MALGPNPNLVDACGRNVLHLASGAGQLECLSVLLARPELEDLQESRTHGGVTPLMYVAQSGNIFAVGECLNVGMNPFSVDRMGLSAYEYAAPFQDVNGQSMQELVE